MQFLKALFWVAIGGMVVFLGIRNWHDVTLNMWGDIQVDIKVPILVGLLFLIGWLPTYLICRARVWRLRHRLDSFERQQAMTREPPQVVVDEAPAQ